MLIDTIVSRYQEGTLVNEPEAVLHKAWLRISMVVIWVNSHPESKHVADLPSRNTLQQIADFLENHLAVTYGCND